MLENTVNILNSQEIIMLLSPKWKLFTVRALVSVMWTLLPATGPASLFQTQTSPGSKINKRKLQPKLQERLL